MLISKAARQAYVDRDFDSFVWMKKLKLEDLQVELSHLKVKPQFKTTPWLHQLVCFFIGLRYPRFLFLLDMGAGKSKILMDLITQFQREKKLTRALITVPRLINIGSWEEDIGVHSCLEPIMVNAQGIDEKWDALMTGRGDLALIDYQGLCLAVCDKVKKTARGKKQVVMTPNEKKMKMLRQRYDFIGLDESHKVKNSESLWFEVLEQICEQADFVYATTGTLFGKDPEDMWAQFRLVDGGETFGQDMGLFRTTFYDTKPGPWKVIRTFDKKQSPLLNAMIQNRSIRYNAREFGKDVPDSVLIRRSISFSDEQRDHYLRALEGLINAGGKFSEMESSWVQLRYITAGYLHWKDEHGEHTVPFKENPKLEALEAILDEVGDEKVVISHEYTETGRMISEMLKRRKIKHVWLYGGAKDSSGMRRKFIDDPDCQVFLMNSESGGTGVDGLQKVSHYLVLYETPCPPITRKQVIKRIHRPGQRERSFVYDLAMKRSVDIGILDDVLEGIDFYDSVVDPRKAAGRLKNLFAKGG